MVTLDPMHSFRLPFDTSREVSSAVSFALILSIAFSIAWLSLAAGENVVNNFENSSSIQMRNQTIETEFQ